VSAAEQAAREAAEAVGAINARRRFTVSKFGRHADGYLHARVVVDGRPYYFHRRYGSWLAPGQVGTKSVLKEAEALVGPEIGREVKYALAGKARAWLSSERKQQEEGRDGTRSNDAAVRDDRLRQRQHHEHAQDAVRSD
jgi:hypothetical protein